MTRRIDNPQVKAEGTMRGVPYDTQLLNADGCVIHFWLGDDCTPERAEKLRRYATGIRDIVGCTYSDGEPTGFWAQENHG